MVGFLPGLRAGTRGGADGLGATTDDAEEGHTHRPVEVDHDPVRCHRHVDFGRRREVRRLEHPVDGAASADVVEAARVGAAAGAFTVGVAGASPSMPTRAQVDAILDGR